MFKKIGLLFLLTGCLSNSFDMACNLVEYDDCNQLFQVVKVMKGSLNFTNVKLENKIHQLDNLCNQNNHYACRAISAYYIDNNNYYKAAQYLEKVCNIDKIKFIDACNEVSLIYKQDFNDNQKYLKLQQIRSE